MEKSNSVNMYTVDKNVRTVTVLGYNFYLKETIYHGKV
nr:MAG TPA: hypothetical protein [Caudoviricetes sp.]